MDRKVSFKEIREACGYLRRAGLFRDDVIDFMGTASAQALKRQNDVEAANARFMAEHGITTGDNHAQGMPVRDQETIKRDAFFRRGEIIDGVMVF